MWRLPLVAISFAALWLSTAMASPWPREAGERFNRAEFDAFWSEREGHAFRQLTTREYLEIGVGPALTIGGQLASVTQLAEGPGYIHERDGIVEADLFVTLHTEGGGPNASAWQFSGGLPTAKFDDQARVMGQDSYVGLAHLAGLSHGPWFTTTQLGARYSLGDDADQIRWNLSAGVQSNRFMVLLQSFNTVAVTSPEPTGVDFDLSQLRLSAVVKIRPRWRVEWGARVDAYTRGVTPGQSLFFSLWWAT